MGCSLRAGIHREKGAVRFGPRFKMNIPILFQTIMGKSDSEYRERIRRRWRRRLRLIVLFSIYFRLRTRLKHLLCLLAFLHPRLVRFPFSRSRFSARFFAFAAFAACAKAARGPIAPLRLMPNVAFLHVL